MSEKRSVHTDALDTMGTIISEGEQRDAIHLAVEPAVAACQLRPGEHVGFMPDRTVAPAYSITTESVGIVDPFLTQSVEKGQRFWLVVYPRQITSLRHVWTHPAFEEETVATNPAVEKSRRWIEVFASDIYQSYDDLMMAANRWIRRGDYTYDNSESYKLHWDKFDEFWKHYEVVTGQEVDDSDRGSFFTCSC